MFSIKLLPAKTPRTANAEIVIGNHREIIEVPLQYWRREQYRAQWREAIGRLQSGHASSCLITSMVDPAKANFLMWWPMWREGETVFIQNQLLFMDSIQGRFDERNPYRHIPVRATKSEDGEKVSEWSIPLQTIRSL
ncbi:MAG: hypothetical protein M0D55_07535 [Elusimicrobiota bacterium]|nr:MAG: hypothetical protein M0D55_07535 [Elusimicrobiota bacterium]